MDIWSHSTGTPNHGSAEPHLPGPININCSFSDILLLMCSISLAIISVWDASKVLGSTITIFWILSIKPFPNATELLQNKSSLFMESNFWTRSMPPITIGFIWSRQNSFSLSLSLCMLIANSISIGQPKAFSPIFKTSINISGIGALFHFKKDGKVITRVPECLSEFLKTLSSSDITLPDQWSSPSFSATESSKEDVFSCSPFLSIWEPFFKSNA